MPVGMTPEMENMMSMQDAIRSPGAQEKLVKSGMDAAQASSQLKTAERELLGQMRSLSEFSIQRDPFAEGFTGYIGNPKAEKAPWQGEYDMPGNYGRRQNMANSMANDAMLRNELSYTRKREADEPEGSFALSRYPGVEQHINFIEQGFGSWGHASNFMDSQELQALRAKATEWAEYQRGLLGLPQKVGRKEFRAGGRAKRSMSLRDRMGYLAGR